MAVARSEPLHAETDTCAAIRLAGVAGLVSVVPGAIGVLVDRMWAFPGTGASASQIAAFTDAHRTALLSALALSTITVWLWLVFGVGVWLWMRQTTSNDTERYLTISFLAGLIGFVTLLLAGFTAFFVLVYRAPGSSDPRLLRDLAFGLLAMSGLPTALALGSYAEHALRGRRLPSSTAVVAAVAAVAHIVLFASLLISGGFFSLEGGVIIAIPATLFIWVAVTGGAMSRL